MKKFLLGILVIVVVLAFMPLNAQMPDKKIEPLEEPKDKTDAKKYEIKVIYTKGMEYERSFKIKIKMDMGGMGMNADAVIEVKTKNTVLDVKDGQPIDFKCQILDANVTGEMPQTGMDEGSNEIEDVKKLKGHWFRIKINDKGEYELVEKSENFPELEGNDMFEDLSETSVMMFDKIDLPKKPIAVGESFKFDFNNQMPSKDMMKDMSGGTDLNDLMVKFDKVVEKDGVVIGYFSGKLEQEMDGMGAPMKLTVTTKMAIDITNSRCLNIEVMPSFSMSTEEFSMEIIFGMSVVNTFGKTAVEEKKPEVTPKSDDE